MIDELAASPAPAPAPVMASPAPELVSVTTSLRRVVPVFIGEDSWCSELGTLDTTFARFACSVSEVAFPTAAACWATPLSLVTFGAGVNGVTSHAAAEPAAYAYIAAASCAHISPYSASVAAMAAVFCPKKLVATSVASCARLAATAGGGTVIAKAASKTSTASLA